VCDGATWACITSYELEDCEFVCCGLDQECVDGGCFPCISNCDTAIRVLDPLLEFSIDWLEEEDDFTPECAEMCLGSSGSDVMFRVDVLRGDTVCVELDAGYTDTFVHVLDSCPSDWCEESRPGDDGSMCWVNTSGRDDTVFIVLEGLGDRHDPTVGRIYRTPVEGDTCEVAIHVPSLVDGFEWTVHTPYFRSTGPEVAACGIRLDRDAWVQVEVPPGIPVSVVASGPDLSPPPTVGVLRGDCDELECLGFGEGSVRVGNRGDESVVFSIFMSWATSYEGDIVIEIAAE
jgi:hypothetical protein